MTLDGLEPWPIVLIHTFSGMAKAADFFLRTLTASNFAAHSSTDPIFLAFKDLIPFQRVSKVQEASSSLTSQSDLLFIGLIKEPYVSEVPQLYFNKYWLEKAKITFDG